MVWGQICAVTPAKEQQECYLQCIYICDGLFCTGEIAPVGPTSFEFVIPEGAPINISPSVGTVEPGKVLSNLLEQHRSDLYSR